MEQLHTTIRVAVPQLLEWAVYKKRTYESDEIVLPYLEHQSVKDCVESIGIPHTEVDRYFVKDQEVPEDYIMNPDDTVVVVPLGRQPYRDHEFILDVHLGKLATYLRLLGFSAEYDSTLSQDDLLALSHTDRAILLTRSRRLLMRRELQRGMLIQSIRVDEQLYEVCDRYDLIDHIQLMTRCPHCNGIISRVSKDSIVDRLETGTRSWYDVFFQCESCGQVYWEGSHYPGLLGRLDRLRSRLL